jgi:hypothetical protein
MAVRSALRAGHPLPPGRLLVLKQTFSSEIGIKCILRREIITAFGLDTSLYVKPAPKCNGRERKLPSLQCRLCTEVGYCVPLLFILRAPGMYFVYDLMILHSTAHVSFNSRKRVHKGGSTEYLRLQGRMFIKIYRVSWLVVRVLYLTTRTISNGSCQEMYFPCGEMTEFLLVSKFVSVCSELAWGYSISLLRDSRAEKRALVLQHKLYDTLHACQSDGGTAVMLPFRTEIFQYRTAFIFPKISDRPVARRHLLCVWCNIWIVTAATRWTLLNGAEPSIILWPLRHSRNSLPYETRRYLVTAPCSEPDEPCPPSQTFISKVRFNTTLKFTPVSPKCPFPSTPLHVSLISHKCPTYPAYLILLGLF